MQISNMISSIASPRKSGGPGQAPATVSVGVRPAADAAPPVRYDFSNISRDDLATTGKQLFKSGEITLDELFKFENPTIQFRIGPGGEFQKAQVDPDRRIDFAKTLSAQLAEQRARKDTGPKSGYAMLQTLLGKIQQLQGDVPSLNRTA